jgi:ribonuclease BN (tRNA processing enzyme)
MHVTSNEGSFVFSGDTTTCPEFIAALNAIPDLRHLVIETSFENALAGIAEASRHHWPDSLAADLAGLTVKPQIWITHLKPGSESRILAELKQAVNPDVKAMRQGQILHMIGGSPGRSG